jgi:hypothetical protein
MLTINNIEKLNNKTIGAWRVAGVEIDYQRTSQSPDHSYTIRLSRSGLGPVRPGAAIIIEREAGQFGYNVSVCYEDYDNVISINAVGEKELKNKDVFLSLMRGILDAEYDKNK